MKEFSMWEILPISCILSSKKGAIIDVNPSAEIYLKTAKKNLLYKTMHEVFRSDIDFLKHFESFSKKIREGTQIKHWFRRFSKQNKHNWEKLHKILDINSLTEENFIKHLEEKI